MDAKWIMSQGGMQEGAICLVSSELSQAERTAVTHYIYQQRHWVEMQDYISEFKPKGYKKQELNWTDAMQVETDIQRKTVILCNNLKHLRLSSLLFTA